MPVTVRNQPAPLHTTPYYDYLLDQPPVNLNDAEFLLGISDPSWLRRLKIPMFISTRRLRKYKTLPIAKGEWGLDSGGFTELTMYGGWMTTPEEYINEINRYAKEIGNLEWAASQDYMCENQIRAKTGMSTLQHQELTINRFIELHRYECDTEIVPVIQGQTIEEYLRHIEMYGERGIELKHFPRVGVGSVCRRQNTEEITEIITAIAEQDIRIHAFGVKVGGLNRYSQLIQSSDSMYWSRFAREHGWINARTNCHWFHINCANCIDFAVMWRDYIVNGWPPADE